jgi:type III secretion protein Q
VPQALFDSLRVPLRFELGHTTIQLHEVRRIEPGDIVGIEHWRSHGPAIALHATPGGSLRLDVLAEGPRITVQSIGDPVMTPSHTAAPATAEDATNLPLDRLDALEVSLRFEVGELQVSLGELKTLKPGHVFDLGQPLNRCVVRVLAHGNVLGKGHLVAVGDRLGVRISDFAAGSL